MAYKTELTSQLVDLLKDKKTLVLIDGANLYFAAHKKRWNIDFNQLYSWFAGNTKLVETIYYTAFNPEDIKQNEFIAGLVTSGYTVHKKPIKTFSDSSIKGNLDVEICVDTMKQIFNFQILVLISGDGDFTYLAQTLESMGKKVIVIGVGGFMSFELQEQADNYFLLDRIKKVWQMQKQVKLDTKNQISDKNTTNPNLAENKNSRPNKTQNSAPKKSTSDNLSTTTNKSNKTQKTQTKQISLDGLEVHNQSKNTSKSKQRSNQNNPKNQQKNQNQSNAIPEIFV